MDIVERLREPVSKDDPYICTNTDIQPEIKYDLLRSQAADEIERLREALKPFASVVKGNWNEQPDTMPMSYGFGVDKRFDLTLGDFRKARAALKGDE